MAGMTEKEYRSHPAISRSELWRIAESPEKFRYYREHPPEPTPALVFGQLFHKLALEPQTFEEDFALFPERTRKAAGYKSFKAEHLDKTIVTIGEYEQASAMARAMYQNNFARKLLSGEREKAFFWDDDLTGEACKCRVDAILETDKADIITDVKTAASAVTEDFIREAIRYGYDFQSGMYTEGVQKCTGKTFLFVFVVVEKEPPYAVNVLQADELFVRRGYDLFREYIGMYHDCKTTDNWYGYLGKYNMINTLGLPAWLAKEIE